MPLRSTNPAHDYFLSVPVILMDTGALIWLCRQDDHPTPLRRLLSCYSMIVPAPTLYEFAFGQSHEMNPNERRLREEIDHHRLNLDVDKFFRLRDTILPGEIFIHTPSYFEWKQARSLVLNRLELCRGKLSNKEHKKDHSLDALIYACGRNLAAPICTRDVSDFTKLNEAAVQRGPCTMPFYTPEQLFRSLDEEVCFEDPIIGPIATTSVQSESV